MIGRLSSFLIAATSLRTDAPRDTLELIDFEGVHTESGGSLEGIEGLENPALFLEYLLQQYKPSTAKTEKATTFQLPTDVQTAPADFEERIIISPDGQGLPYSGNRFPLTGSMGADSKFIPLPMQGTTEVSSGIEPTFLSFAALNRGAGVVQVADHELDLQTGPENLHKPLGNRVLWMVSQKMQTAELRVNPPQLGPVELRISVEGDQTNVSLIAQHAAVREVMENAIPKLRDMLAESGLNLVNIDVSQHDLSQRRHEASHFSAAGQEKDESPESHTNANSVLKPLPSRTVELSLIDFYAWANANEKLYERIKLHVTPRFSKSTAKSRHDLTAEAVKKLSELEKPTNIISLLDPRFYERCYSSLEVLIASHTIAVAI